MKPNDLRRHSLSRLWFRYLQGSELEDTVSVESLAAMLEALDMISLHDDRTTYSELPKFKRYHRRFWLLSSFEKLKSRYEKTKSVSPIY